MKKHDTNILLIDDSPTNLLLMENMLKKTLEVNILTAPSGQEGLDIMQNHDFAVVLLDVEMPRMNGFEVADKIHASEKFRHTPVIFVTAHTSQKANLFKGYESGAVDFLFKPIQTEILCSKVKVFLDLYQQKQALKSLLAHVEKQRMELSALNDKQKLILENVGEGIMGLDTSGRFTFVNNAALKMLRRCEEELIGEPMHRVLSLKDESDLFTDEVTQKIAQEVERHIGAQDNKYVSLKRKDGSHLPIRYVVNFLSDQQGDTLGTVIIFEDISDRIKVEKKLTRQASRDRLTGLPNRFLFEKAFQKIIAEAEVESKRVALLFIDLDHFKDVNDTLGHQAGDALLKKVAKRIQGVLKESDLVSRIGGDEFTVILQDIHALDQVAEIVQRILKVLSTRFDLKGHAISTNASIGIAIYPDSGTTPKTLIKHADMAMYRVKKEGRGDYLFFTKKLTDMSKERLQLVSDLHHALDNNEFSIHYQPQFNIQTRKLVGFEALIRWQHPEKGLVPPETFIPIAEKNGLISQIGEWILREAYKTFQGWHSEKLINDNIVLSVNLSSAQLLKNDFLDAIKKIEEELDIQPNCLELELRETSLLEKSEKTLQTLEALRKLDIRITIDDFGTGYSSLVYLKRLPIQTLKIKRSFIVDIAENKDSAAIAISTIQLAHSLSLCVVAEGVETKAQLEFLKKHHCDVAQGFYLSKPLTSEDIATLLRSSDSAMV